MNRGRSLVAGIVSSFVVLATGGCSGGGAGADVDRFDAEGDVPGGSIVAVDAGLVGVGDSNNGRMSVSHDGGRTWRFVELPDAPREVWLSDMVADGDVIAVVGHDRAPVSPDLPAARSEIIVWTSADGDRWERTAIGTSGPVVEGPAVAAVGPVLVAVTSTSAGFDVFTSADRGASWGRAGLTGLDLEPGVGLDVVEAMAAWGRLHMVVGSTTGWPDGRHWVLTSVDDGASWSATPCALDCSEVLVPGTPVAQGDEVTTDGGATWHRISVDPPPSDQDGPFLSTPVEVPGGWLASATTSDPGDADHSMLLRSDDGRSWRQMLPPDPCGGNRPDSDVSEPFRFRGRWYVTYECDEEGVPTSAVLYDGGTDARTFEPVEGTERDGVTFGRPIRDGERLLLPEFGGRDLGGDELVGFTTLG